MTKNTRAAGILMHITSLPSAFGIGDLGPEARNFVDFLHRCKQKYWQLLPLNPIEAGQGHSPYSSISSRAGNTLLISPELLASDGLISNHELEDYRLPPVTKVDFAGAQKNRKIIFDIAYRNFKEGNAPALEADFKHFISREAGWLHDFALYMLLKNNFGGKAWFNWPDEFKFRDSESLQKLTDENFDEIRKIKWLQFMFSRQWNELRTYGSSLNVQFFGDLPFYISYDSVDVWSQPDIFSLDEKGKMIGVAGVPPDAFSDDGQLWGMPVFLWDVLKAKNYSWWVERLTKNIELFDLVRLDHFRAFAAFWQVPANADTAKNGKWHTGPGSDLFHTVKNELGALPFIAEDLGEIDEPVYELRDAFSFPGMKILQFAFGDTLPASPYIPHNYTENFIAYTGTHDNNTIKGWYRNEGKEHHRQINEYMGKVVNENNVHIEFNRLAFSSVAKIAIIPLQDLLGLDEEARMNTPASGANNWGWRLLPGQLTSDDEKNLREITVLYNRVAT